MYEIQEKIDTYDFCVVYETYDEEFALGLLEEYRKKYKYRKFRVVKVIK